MLGARKSSRGIQSEAVRYENTCKRSERERGAERDRERERSDRETVWGTRSGGVSTTGMFYQIAHHKRRGITGS